MKASPLAPKERILSLDVLRGIAVLGILIMNIQSFSMISASYQNPTAHADFEGINRIAWIITYLFANSKFMTIFSLLFGTGLLMMYDRLQERKLHPGAIHYRRMMWLLVFGMLHAYLLWYGDILVNYALCGMLAFLFRKKKIRTLYIWAAVFFIIPVLLNIMSGWSVQYWPEESLQQSMLRWAPPADEILKEITAMRGSWLEQMDVRIPVAIMVQTMAFFFFTLWRVLGLMLIGMAFYRTGIVLAQKSPAYYKRMLWICLPAGWLLSGWGIWLLEQHEWSMEFGLFLGVIPNYFGSVFSALAYVSLIMLVSQSQGFKRLKSAMAATGKMALSNYLLTTILCTFLFYGHGFGLFETVGYAFQQIIVIFVWIILIVFSLLWLKKYRFGPFEFLWRSLTYWTFPAMRKKDA